MKSIVGKIKEMKWTNKWFLIKINNEDIKIPIIDGNVEVMVMNDNNIEVGLKYLEIGDIIKINIKKNDLVNIILNSKYDFISSSSETDEII